MSDTQSFSDISARLDEIVSQVRSKDTSLEKSLDLFDEAIKLGSQAVDMVDSVNTLTPEEMDAAEAEAEPAEEQDA